MAENKTHKIDIEKVIRDKNPKLLKILPRFVINYIKKIIHQNDINYELEKNKDLIGLDFVEAIISDFNLDVKIYGLENIPKTGRFIFASNHPLGGLESMVFMSAVSKVYNNNFKFLVNDILMNLKNLEPLFLPINKHGAQARESAKIIDETYKTDKQILIYPAGLVSRRIKGKIVDLEWQKSFVSKAILHKRDIIPIFIEGKNSNFFYNLASLRKFFKIKANIEMFYLVNEAFKQKNKTIPIYFGKPISYKMLKKSKIKHNILAEKIKNYTFSLKNNINLEFNL